MCYLGGIWRRLEQLEQIYGRFPSVDQSGRFAGVPNLGKPLYRARGGGTWVFFGWVCAARDSELAPRSKNISPKIDTPF